MLLNLQDSSTIKTQHLLSIEYLRAFAALTVLVHHWTVVPGIITNPVMFAFCETLNIGVYVFFTLSGFVMPYAMSQGGYQLRYAHRFFAKRVIRLDPAYFASIFFCLVVAFAASKHPSYTGAPFAIDWFNLALHPAYLCPFFKQPWVQGGIYWTLGIEAQFYVAMALLFPVLMHARFRVILLLAIAAIPLVADVGRYRFICPYVAFFGLGIVTFLYFEQRIGKRSFLLGTILFLSVCCYRFQFHQALGGLIPVVVITCCRDLPNISIARYLGKISYSLYLFHFPIAHRVINYLSRFPDSPHYALLIVCVGSLVCIGLAHVMYHLIESPSQRLAGMISYKPCKKPAVSRFVKPVGKLVGAGT